MLRTAGLFLTHLRNERIDAHYARLVRETEGLVDWKFAFNPSSLPEFEIGIPYRPAEECMPARYVEMTQNGGIIGGYVDMAIIPPALALDADFTWVMEFDVDYSGDWSRFFRQFANDRADLLTSTIVRWPKCQDWHWWWNAGVPDTISRERMFRAFHPMMRISRRFARTYAGTIAHGGGWSGHYEFLLPTLGVAAGLSVKDLGGARASRPETWNRGNYVNEPLNQFLRPGTYRWRPPHRFYFHEEAERFPIPNKLYHPVKPQGPFPAMSE